MNATRAKELLVCAVECDKIGRILEAQNLYEEGIDELMKFINLEANDDKRKAYMLRVKEYMDRAEILRARVSGHMQQGEIVTRIAIEEDMTGQTYETLFGKYMNETTREILLEETYIRKNYQFSNLVRFLELAVTNCPNLKYVSIVTKEDPDASDQQKTNMGHIRSDMKTRKIRVDVKYDDQLHDRKIVLSNGYIISIGRGLHFYKPTDPLYSLGLGDYKFRKCLKTDVTIARTKNAQD